MEKIQELERKADKIRRLLEEDDTSLHENEEEIDGIVDKPHKSVYVRGGPILSEHFFLHAQNRMFRLHRVKSKSFYDGQRQKLEKLESQLKDLREGGVVDSRGARIRGRIEGGLRM